MHRNHKKHAHQKRIFLTLKVPELVHTKVHIGKKLIFFLVKLRVLGVQPFTTLVTRCNVGAETGSIFNFQLDALNI